MTVEGWSTDPAQNAIQGNIDFSENMKPAKVNDSMRQLMADVAVWRDKLVTTTALYSTLTDDLTLFQDPTAAMHAATKQYVDAGDASLQAAIDAAEVAIASLESFRTSLMAGSQASMDTFLEAYNEFQATDDAIVALNNLVATKAASDHNHDAAYLGKTAQAEDSKKLGGVLASEYALNSKASVAPIAVTISDWDQAEDNGVYIGYNASNAPASGWCAGETFRYSTPWAMQRVWVWSGTIPDEHKIFVRDRKGGVWGPWEQVTAKNYTVYHPDNVHANFDLINGLFGGMSPNGLGTPTGTIIAFAATATPSGYLSCYGQAISRTTYAALFAAIGTKFGSGDGSTTFNLPDLRGEFLRGWDNSRGVDSGRAIGTWQEDDLKAHNHSFTAPSSTVTGNYWGPTYGGRDTSLVFSTNSTGGTETRPRNISVHYCIKY